MFWRSRRRDLDLASPPAPPPPPPTSGAPHPHPAAGYQSVRGRRERHREAAGLAGALRSLPRAAHAVRTLCTSEEDSNLPNSDSTRRSTSTFATVAFLLTRRSQDGNREEIDFKTADSGKEKLRSLRQDGEGLNLELYLIIGFIFSRLFRFHGC